MTDQHWTNDPHRAQPMGTVTERHPRPGAAADYSAAADYLRSDDATRYRRLISEATTSREVVVLEEGPRPGPPPMPEPPSIQPQGAAVLVSFYVPADQANAILALRHGTVGLDQLDDGQRADALSSYYADAGRRDVQRGLQRWTERIGVLARWRRP